MIEHKSIHEAMLAIYNEVGYVQKQSSGSLKYTFAGEGAFIRKLRPAMIENGVTISVKSMDDMHQERYTTASNTSMVRSVIHATVRFSHAGGEFLDVEAYGEGSDAGDKSLNKAMTDAYKYALRQTFMIETGDDPDEESEESMTQAAVKQGAVEKKENKKNPPVPLENVPQMSLELAQSETTSKGDKYGDLDNDRLTFMYNAMKAKEASEEITRKMVAIQTILLSRQKKG